MINFNDTVRGLACGTFTDKYDKECSIQKSSLATEECIWLGIDYPEPKICVTGEGWHPYPIPEKVMINTRMHLNQKMAAELIPILQHFVDTGELPSNKDNK